MTILIVDDLKVVTEGLLRGIDWKGMGFENVYTANSARDARDQILRNPIDVMLCDIEMPNETGLELYEWVIQENYEMECIFLTSHAEFDYAQKALRLGSFDYVLQPASYEEIANVVTRVKMKVLKKQREKRRPAETYEDEAAERMSDSLFREMYEADRNDLEIMKRIFEMTLSDKRKAEAFGVLLVQILDPSANYCVMDNTAIRREMKESLKVILTSYQEEVIVLDTAPMEYAVLVTTSHNNVEVWNQILDDFLAYEKEYEKGKKAFYIGDVVKKEGILQEVKNLKQFSANNILKNPGVFYKSDTISEDMVIKLGELHFERWEYYLKMGYYSRIPEIIEEFFQNLEREKIYSSGFLQTIFWKFNSSCVTVLNERNIDHKSLFPDNEAFREYMESYSSYESLIRSIHLVLESFSGLGSSTEESEEDIIEKVIGYIQEHISQKTTRTEIAEYVHLNEDYLTRLFYKKTGYMLKEYITNEKIKEAKMLLKDTNLTVSVIALKLGFSSFSHFTQVFKKSTGITPSEYRSENDHH